MMKQAAIRLYKRTLVRRAFYRFHHALLNIGLWGVGALNSEDATLSGEDHFLRQLRRYLPLADDLVIWDVGAHTGAYATRARRYHPAARIYAFEPHPATFQQLLRATRRARVMALELALSDTPGTATLFDRAAGGSTHASLHRAVIEAVHHAPALTSAVRVTTVDQLAHDLHLKRINLLKIDAEGSELRIVQGAGRLLAAGAIDALQFEFNEMNTVSRAFLRDFSDLLAGYDLYRLLPDGLVALADQPIFLREIFAYQNIVALRRAP